MAANEFVYYLYSAVNSPSCAKNGPVLEIGVLAVLFCFVLAVLSSLFVSMFCCRAVDVFAFAVVCLVVVFHCAVTCVKNCWSVRLLREHCTAYSVALVGNVDMFPAWTK